MSKKGRAGIAIQGEFGYNGKKKMADYNQTAKKVPEAEQLAPVGVHRYGRARVAMEVQILAEQAELQQNRSLYVILRNAVTKNPFSTEVRRSFAFAQDDIERNLGSASVYIRALVILILTVTDFFDSLNFLC